MPLLGVAAIRNALPRVLDHLVHGKRDSKQRVGLGKVLLASRGLGARRVHSPAYGHFELLDEEGRKVGRARMVYKRIDCPVCSDAQFLIVQRPAGAIVRVVPVIGLEVQGRPIDGRKFLAQFVGKRPGDRLRPGHEVDVISGATKTSLKYIEGIRETLGPRPVRTK